MISTNEKTAKKIAKLVSDWDINPEQVGKYIARISPDFVVTKLQVVSNSAIMELSKETETYNISFITEEEQIDN